MHTRPTKRLQIVVVGLVVIGCLELCGCHKTAMVFGPSLPHAALTPDGDRQASDKNELPGIPFYTYRGVCTLETVWLEPQTTLSFTVTADGGRPVTQAMVLNNLAFHDPNSTTGHDANSLVTSLMQASGKHEGEMTADKKLCPAKVAQDWSAVRDFYKVQPIDETNADSITSNEAKRLLVRVSNTADIGKAVDYSRVYYLNARSPLIGTGTVDAKLNTDGTLSEGSASVNDQTLGDVLTAASAVGSAGLSAWSTVAAARITGSASAPSPDVTTSEALSPQKRPPACEPEDGWPAVKENVKYEFSVTPGGFKHDHKIVTPLEDSKGVCTVSGMVMGGSYTITPIKGGDKSDDDAIGVSGTITLPKAKTGGGAKK